MVGLVVDQSISSPISHWLQECGGYNCNWEVNSNYIIASQYKHRCITSAAMPNGAHFEILRLFAKITWSA